MENNPLLSGCTSSWEKEYEMLPQYRGMVKSFGLSPAVQSAWIKMIDVITENTGWMGIAVYQVLEAAHCFAPASGLGNGKMKRAIFDFMLSHQCRRPSWEATSSTKQSKPENLVLMQIFTTRHAVTIWNNTLRLRSAGKYFKACCEHKPKVGSHAEKKKKRR